MVAVQPDGGGGVRLCSVEEPIAGALQTNPPPTPPEHYDTPSLEREALFPRLHPSAALKQADPAPTRRFKTYFPGWIRLTILFACSLVTKGGVTSRRQPRAS